MAGPRRPSCPEAIRRAGRARVSDPLKAHAECPTPTREEKGGGLRATWRPYRYSATRYIVAGIAQNIGHPANNHLREHPPARQKSTSANFGAIRFILGGPHLLEDRQNPSGVGEERTVPGPEKTYPPRRVNGRPVSQLRSVMGEFTHTTRPNSDNLLIGVGFST